MHILMRFEDSYGCRTLFDYSNSILKDTQYCDLEIIDSLGDTGIFQVSKRQVMEYDYILLIFDMDNDVAYSLTSQKLRKQLKKHILMEDGTLKENYKGKIILLPVFFCFETMYLFSKEMQKIIADIDSIEECMERRLIEIYKSYYDYSFINPENLHEAEWKLSCIQQEVAKITGEVSKNRWLPQKFHLSYAKQLLKIMCKNVKKEAIYNKLGDKLFEKHEDILFKKITEVEQDIKIHSIIEGLGEQCNYNQWFYNILTLDDINDLSDMVIDKNLEKICKMVDEYNNSIREDRKENGYKQEE